MARGRKPIPDAIKQLKGNPGKRRLAIAGGRVPEENARGLKAPEFLTGSDERKVFRLVCDELVQRRFIRQTDMHGLARWAYYVAQWARAKRDLGRKKLYYETESKHGAMLRIHPLFQTIAAMERLMVPLEDRLGLSPAARQTIVRGMMANPSLAQPTEELFPEPSDGAPQPPAMDAPPADTAVGPLGFLQQTRH